jgi:hypothetical protein
VELYNPAEIYAAFAEAAREQAGLPEQPTGAEDLLETAGISVEEGVGLGTGDLDAYAGAADEWAATHVPEPADTEEAARLLYDLALTFQERSQQTEARLLDQFQDSSEGLAAMLGDHMILDDEDERLWFRANGTFEAEVVPERSEDEAPSWKALTSADEMVQFYDPTDLFGDLAEAIAEHYPAVAPELDEADS